MSEDNEDCYYLLAWSCVDGAGHDGTRMTDMKEAVALAQRHQAGAEAHGNEWVYTYRLWEMRGGYHVRTYNVREGMWFRCLS